MGPGFGGELDPDRHNRITHFSDAACGGTFFYRMNEINKIFFYFYPEYPVYPV
jgi:hypothetical protein